MKGFLFALVLVLAGVIGFGFYRGWFSTGVDTTDHKSNLNLSVDRDRVRDDTNRLRGTTPTGTTVSEPDGPALTPKK